MKNAECMQSTKYIHWHGKHIVVGSFGKNSFRAYGFSWLLTCDDIRDFPLLFFIFINSISGVETFASKQSRNSIHEFKWMYKENGYLSMMYQNIVYAICMVSSPFLRSFVASKMEKGFPWKTWSNSKVVCVENHYFLSRKLIRGSVQGADIFEGYEQ